MTFVPNSPTARFGTYGEARVEDWLKQRDLFVTRLCNIRNVDGIGAPMLMGARCNLILPDFQIIDPRKLGQPFYVEVKTKTVPAWYAKGYCYTHGIDTANWRHYKRISLTTGLPVWLLILDDMSGELLGLQIHRCTPDHHCEPNEAFPKGGGTFWRRSQLLLIAQLERRQHKLDV